ncbi:hypothetical protein ACLGIH_33250 [Streptomyces sp. HMX87]|uniref:hypothetical protein n=1 Tax=Streptomyces sp. HMX87 TaxID=3390849 RepID=UPI003A8BC148
MSDVAQGDARGVRQAGQTAKEQASATAGQARQAAGTVAGEARQQAGTAVSDLRERVTQEAESQTQRAAGTVRQWSDELSELARNAPEDSPARSLVSQVADGGHRAAEYLDKQGVEGMTEDLKGFARRRPGAFLAGAALAGLVVGRMAKAGSKASQSSQGPQQDPVRDGRPGVQEAAVRPELPGSPEV